jgi:hypothetical protein
MTKNCELLSEYINCLQPGTWIVDPRKRALYIPETRSCICCGAPYTLKTPYELCQPFLRDLCDECLQGPDPLSLSLSLSSGADPDQLRALKLGGI